MWWTGPNGPNVFGNPIPGATVDGYGGIPAVDRATQLIVGTFATLPWHVYRDETERLPTPDWIADPQAFRLDGRVVDAGRDVGDAPVARRLLGAVDPERALVG